MSQGIEVGDKVKVINAGEISVGHAIYESIHHINEGEIYTVSFVSNSGSRIGLKELNGESYIKKRFELVLKGSDQKMTDNHTIVVEVDDDYIRKSFRQLACDNGYKDNYTKDNTTVYWGVSKEKKKIWALSNNRDYVTRDFDYKEPQIYKLPEKWDEVVEFIGHIKSFTINGRKVEVEEAKSFADYKIKIGCWSEQAGVIEHFAGNIERFGVDSGKLTIDGESISVSKILELRDWLHDNYK